MSPDPGAGQLVPYFTEPNPQNAPFSHAVVPYHAHQYPRARDYEVELSQIRSVQEILIDHSIVLTMKRGDLAIIQGEVFKCVPAAPHLQHIPLIVKRLDCVDRRIFDLKVHECDTFMRFKGNPNIVTLFSYWSERA